MTGHGWVRAVAVAVAVAVLSVVRRALPATALVAAGLLCGGTEGGGLLLPVVAWSAGARITGVLRALLAFSASFALYAALVVWIAHPGWVWLAVMHTLFFLVFAVVPGLANRYWTQRRTLLDTLRERNAQLLRERQMIAGQARMRERQRIAQDMHDSLGHQLALIAVQTGALEVDRELTGRQREAVGVLREASVAAMQELREVVGILKDGTHDEGQPASRVVAEHPGARRRGRGRRNAGGAGADGRGPPAGARGRSRRLPRGAGGPDQRGQARPECLDHRQPALRAGLPGGGGGERAGARGCGRPGDGRRRQWRAGADRPAGAGPAGRRHGVRRGGGRRRIPPRGRAALRLRGGPGSPRGPGDDLGRRRGATFGSSPGRLGPARVERSSTCWIRARSSRTS
ncbi:hypothetical protein GCM10020000_05930 [Streptomyces olivoverticillatus]